MMTIEVFRDRIVVQIRSDTRKYLEGKLELRVDKYVFVTIALVEVRKARKC